MQILLILVFLSLLSFIIVVKYLILYLFERFFCFFCFFNTILSANQFENMNEDVLVFNLEATFSSAQMSVDRGDADAAVAKTAANPNDQDCSISESDN